MAGLGKSALKMMGLTPEKISGILVEHAPSMLSEAIEAIRLDCAPLLKENEKHCIVSFFPEEKDGQNILFVVVYAALGNGQPTRVIKKSDIRNYLSKLDASMIEKMLG